MHCDLCGAKVQAQLRCPSCRGTLAWIWILGAAALTWAASGALFFVATTALLPEVSTMYEGLGSDLPLPARVFVVLVVPAYRAAILLALLAPVAIVIGRGRGLSVAVWARRYAIAAGLGFAGALAAVGAWYLSVSTILSHLR